MKRYVTVGLMLIAHAAAQTSIDLRTQSRNVDFSGSISTKPVKTGTIMPATCSTGELWFRTDAPAGKNLFACTATNTWTTLSGGTAGADGKSILSGSGAPSNSTGTDGDFYLNTAATCLYGPKNSGAWPGSCTPLVGPAGNGFNGNSSYDGILGMGPGGSAYETGWRAPQSLSTSFYFGLPSVAPGAKSVMVFDAPVTRTGNDPEASSQVADAALLPVSGGGPSLASIQAAPANGCAQISNGQLTSTGVPCGSGAGGGAASTQGTAAAIPATCTVGDLYVPTNSLYTLVRCSATNTWTYFFDGQAVTPPSGTWSWDHATGLGGGTASVDTTRKYWSLKFPSGMHYGTDMTAYYTAAPATPYTRTFVIRPNVASMNAAYQSWYIGFQDSSGKMVAFTADNNGNGDGYRTKYGIAKYTSTTDLTPGCDFERSLIGNLLGGTNVWVRITDNNTNLIFELSFDGQFFTTIQSVSRTAWMAAGPSRIFIGARNAQSGGQAGDTFVNLIGVQ